MPNLNKVLLMGNLTRDVEMRFTPSGTALASFGLAINRKWKNTKTNEMQEEVTFVDVEAWSKLAELCNQYLSKGKPVYIEGRLKLDTWDDKQTGQKRSKMKVVVESMQFLGSGGEKTTASKPAQRPQEPPEDLDIQEESVPF